MLQRDNPRTIGGSAFNIARVVDSPLHYRRIGCR